MNKLKFLKKNIMFFVLAIIAIIVISIIVKYQVEGERNIPFQVSKIMVISNASGTQKTETEHKWDLDLLQNNDIYIDIIKNKNYAKEEIIDKIIFDNFEIEEEPQKGKVVIYSPSSMENGVYHNEEQYEVNDKIEYTGIEESSDIKNLQISNQGGLLLLRYANTELGTYTSDEDSEIRHDGTLLQKIGINNDELKFKVSFDLSIELKSGKKYKSNVELELPIGNITTDGTTSSENTNKLVFKRY